MIKHVIFDLDGTLADSAALSIAALATVAPKFGLSIPAYASVCQCIGYANPEFYYRLYPDAPIALLDQVSEEVEREELSLLPGFGTKLLFPGCHGMLRELSERGIRLFIASTGDESHVFPLLHSTGIHHFFAAVLCGEPDKIAMLGRIIRAPKEEWLMVGDMGKDLEGARANGIACVGACYGYCVRGREPFDHYIQTPMELPLLLSCSV